MIKIVLDTNIVVSALLNPYGPSYQILALVLSRDIRLCLDGRIWHEYKEVLLRDKFGFTPAAVEDLLNFFDAESFQVAAKPITFKCTDLSDTKFLEVASAAQAEYLITGNLKHYPSHVKNLKIISPARFLTIYK